MYSVLPGRITATLTIGLGKGRCTHSCQGGNDHIHLMREYLSLGGDGTGCLSWLQSWRGRIAGTGCLSWLQSWRGRIAGLGVSAGSSLGGEGLE